MKKNIVISIILIAVILMNTISYATTEVSIETLEASLIKLFGKEIQINGKFEVGETNLTMEAVKVEVGDSKIVITEEGAEKFEPINYVIEDNLCKINNKYSITVTENSSFDEAFQEMGNLMLQQMMMVECYLATADAMGKDLSLAYTYFQQKYNEDIQENSDEEDSYSIIDEVFKMEVVVSETESTVYIEIDLQKMAELNESDLNSTLNYTVTLMEPTEEKTDTLPDEETDGEQEDEPSDEQVDNEQNDEKQEENNVQEEVVKNEVQNNEKDDTQVKTEIPKAGVENIIYMAVIILIATIILYLKSKKYGDIK